MNRFVKGDSLILTEDVSEEFISALKGLIEIILETIKEKENDQFYDQLFGEWENNDNVNQFISWLKRYIEAVSRPFEETKFLEEINDEKFENMTQYCFDNFILQDIEEDDIDTSIADKEEILILKKVILTFIEMTVVNNLSKEAAFNKIGKILNINERQCNLWWGIIKENEDQIWKIVMMTKYTQIEEKLDSILDILKE